ncbi:unnamed protein product [Blepharisma stoltei]|uniref:Uncharacterized protein n=1 Tax=Blepharisma stoltei TaxID=1481888 RepID=A0AAU9IT68_9CILI|nr:unnamed protein product [Blepharisma stoltei]
MEEGQNFDEKIPDILGEIERHKGTNKAMEIRLQLKNQEIDQLQKFIESSQHHLSLQLHLMKLNSKTMLIDPSMNSEINSIRALKQVKKAELSAQESLNAELTNKQFMKGGKHQQKWQQLYEEIYCGFKNYAEGRLQDAHLQLQLEGLKSQEMKQRIDENKELTESLEKEAVDLQGKVNELQNSYKKSLDHLEALKQESSKVKRSG